VDLVIAADFTDLQNIATKTICEGHRSNCIRGEKSFVFACDQ
jgi:hypothetical protein